MNVFELVGTLTLSGADKVNQQLSTLDQKVLKAQKSLKIIGAAFTAVGAAGLAMVSSTKEINAQLGVTALNLGITVKEMRDLALATTNVTFPIDEVTATFDLLARAGVENTEVMKATATAFDTLGDATGYSASQVTGFMVPAMKTFNLSAEEMASKTDMMTYMSRESTMSLEDFNTMVGYTTPELVAAGLTMEDLTAGLIHMEKQGYAPGRVMTREFMKATTLATKENISLTEALGITSEELAGYKEDMAGATGMTQEYADVANEQFTIMDKMKQKWSEMTLGASGFLEPLEPILAGMTAMGPLMIALSTSAGTAAIKWGLHAAAVMASAVAHPIHTAALIASKVALIASTIAIKAVTIAQWLWNVAMTANPIGLIIAAIAGLIAAVIAIVKNWDWVTEKAGLLWSKLKEVWDNIVGLIKGAWDRIVGFVKENWDKILAILFPAMGLSVLIANNWGKIVEVVTGIWEKIKDVFSGVWGAAKEWGMNLVKGLWEGIKSLSSWIWDRVKGFAGDIFNNIKEGLGKLWPFSPSEAGVDIGEGLTEGIRAGVRGALGDVRSAMGDIAGVVSGISAPAAQVMPQGTEGVGGVVNNFNISQLVVREEADVERIARELLRMQQLRVSYGG